MGQRRLQPWFLLLTALLGGAPAAWAETEPASDPSPEGDSQDDATLAPAGPRPPGPSGLPPPSPRPPLQLALGAGGGYAFRPSDDERNHGGAAHLYGDVPLLFGFGLRLEGDLMAWGASAATARPLLRAGVAPSLIYALDETEAVAIIGLGGFGFTQLEVGTGAPAADLGAGVLLSVGVRFPLLTGVDVDAGVRVPFVLWQTTRDPIDVSVSKPLDLPITLIGSVGIVVVPVELWQSLTDDGA